ncbi:hypothetical protein [Sinomonas gamaensis]|uniref:hypothetical protein n=1 Tax=Sinomonas gamaensis TaxID=2565624 RepID=UPI00110971CC|nr:hypothetical protein [Sinomonas gamaensis]
MTAPSAPRAWARREVLQAAVLSLAAVPLAATATVPAAAGVPATPATEPAALAADYRSIIGVL